jgi:hypothetical protein
MGGLAIIQAKHYKNVMGVNHVRELAGAMEEKKAGRGILVTNSWFTTGGWQKADEHGRMELTQFGPLVAARERRWSLRRSRSAVGAHPVLAIWLGGGRVSYRDRATRRRA